MWFVAARRSSFCALMALTSLLASTPLSATGNSPHVNYMLHCQGCHLPGGVGHPGIVPPLRNSVGQFLISETGRAYLVQVPGVAHSDLDNEALAEVLNWVLREFDPVHVDAGFRPYTGAEVANYRSQSIVNLGEVRASLLAQ